MMQPTDTTSNVQVLVRSLLSKLTKRSQKPRPPQSAIQLYSAKFDEQLHAASHFPCTPGFAGTRWLSFPCFTVAAILPFGNVGYNCSLVRTPVGAAQFGR